MRRVRRGAARFRGNPIVVVGGGDTAVEEAAYLSKFGSTVHLLVRRDVLRASKIMANRVQSISNIEVHWSSDVDEVIGDDNAGVTAVRVRNNKTGSKQNVPAAGLFLAIGHTPNVAFLGGQVELTATGYVKWTTPARTYTSVEGVFAAGTWPTPTTGRRSPRPGRGAWRRSTPSGGWGTTG
jgi:thioredoxin reductase (NADPH)